MYVIRRPLILPISTRGCGFIIRSLVNRFQRISVLDDENCYKLANALYRVTLLQIDYKIEEAMQLQYSTSGESFEDIPLLSTEFRRVLDVMGFGFTLLVNYISAIGVVKTAHSTYVPRHPKLKEHSCSPFFIRSDNLRLIAEMLSSDTISNEVKLRFKNLCPIPGAKWDIKAVSGDTKGVGNSTICNLVNMEDIIPSEYGVEQLIEDKRIISSAIERVRRKYPKHISPVRIAWRSDGLPCQNVSTKGVDVCCPSWSLADPITLIDSDKSHHFWYSGELAEVERLRGVVYLLGEDEELDMHKCTGIRCEAGAPNFIKQHYSTALEHLLNTCERW